MSPTRPAYAGGTRARVAPTPVMVHAAEPIRAFLSERCCAWMRDEDRKVFFDLYKAMTFVEVTTNVSGGNGSVGKTTIERQRFGREQALNIMRFIAGTTEPRREATQRAKALEAVVTFCAGGPQAPSHELIVSWGFGGKMRKARKRPRLR